jgi:plastocyanin
MRRLSRIAVPIAAAGFALGATLIPASASPAPSYVQITEKEFTITLSRLRVHQGSAIVGVLNAGMDNHDLVIQSNATGSKPIKFSQISPGSHTSRTIKLAPGRYTLWCSIANHRKLGMVAPLTVTK